MDVFGLLKTMLHNDFKFKTLGSVTNPNNMQVSCVYDGEFCVIFPRWHWKSRRNLIYKSEKYTLVAFKTIVKPDLFIFLTTDYIDLIINRFPNPNSVLLYCTFLLFDFKMYIWIMKVTVCLWKYMISGGSKKHASDAGAG